MAFLQGISDLCFFDPKRYFNRLTKRPSILEAFELQWVDKKKWPPPIIILVLVYMMYNKQ